MWSREVFGETRLISVTSTVSSFLILRLFPVGSQQKPAVPWLRSCDKDRENLWWPPQVHAPYPLRPGREAQSLVTQQQIERGQRHLFPRRAHCRDSEGHDVRKDGVWSVWQNYIQDLCWWQIMELHLLGEGKNPLITQRWCIWWKWALVLWLEYSCAPSHQLINDPYGPILLFCLHWGSHSNFDAKPPKRSWK